MQNPVRTSRRGKTAPAIFANSEADPAPVSASMPSVPALPAAIAAMPAPDAAAAPTARIATPAIPTIDVADAEPVSAGPAPLTASEKPSERNNETVPARPTDIVSAFSKGPFSMATAFDTSKAQDALGDFTARTKGAVEKSVRIAEEVTEFTKGNVEAIVASGRVAAKGIEAIAQDAAETARTGFEHAQTAFKGFTQAKSPSEFFQLQSDYAKTAFDQLVANASKASEQIIKLAGDVAQPLSNRYALASEKVKSAAF